MDWRLVTIKGHAAGTRALARLAALALLAGALGACSLFEKDTILADEPADKLYNEGLYLLNSKKDAKEAAKKFEEVDRQHPYSEWARKSLIMSAYAYYQAGGRVAGPFPLPSKSRRGHRTSARRPPHG